MIKEAERIGVRERAEHALFVLIFIALAMHISRRIEGEKTSDLSLDRVIRRLEAECPIRD